MTNLSFFHHEVEAILRASQRPAETLCERYAIYNEEQRRELVAALISDACWRRAGETLADKTEWLLVNHKDKQNGRAAARPCGRRCRDNRTNGPATCAGVWMWDGMAHAGHHRA